MSSDPQKPAKGLQILQQIIVLCFIAVVSLFALLLSLSFKLGLGIEEIMVEVGTQFFFSYVSPTDKTLGKLGPYPIIMLLYIWALFSILFYIALEWIRNRCRLSLIIPSAHLAFQSLGLIMVGAVLILQTSQQMLLFKYMVHKDRGRTREELIEYIFEDTYRFAKYCKSILPGYHTADFFSDLNQDPPRDAMTAQRRLAYFLYPQIDVRVSRQQPRDCLVLFYVKDAQKYVPPDYEIIGSYKKICHLAVRKDLLDDR
jgi:hypothetical protein